ncbi:MAG TPA: c-type cytochrome [Gammaproteobacteria bacterium]|nr:c-type cytochrome [Gammaproteobacteria bacterium]
MKKLLVILAAMLALVISNANATDMPPLAKKSGCTACHAIDKKIVGPPWAAVGKRYAGDAGAKAALVAKVKKGGKGNWTEVTHGVPMPPYSPRVKDADIEELVSFVLGLGG